MRKKLPLFQYRPAIAVIVGIMGYFVLTGQAPTPAISVPVDVLDATTAAPGQRTTEISTRELRAILQQGEAVVFDARPAEEYALGHIPGSLNLAAKPGVPTSTYVSDTAELDRLFEGNRATPIVLYCNGPWCPRSTLLAEDLLAAGYTNVRRYQLGIPTWRALGGILVFEPAALQAVLATDHSAVIIDVREAERFAAGSVPRAINLPLSKFESLIQPALDDGRLPAKDHNTRIFVFGKDGKDARAVAEELARRAFHNVAYFDQSYERLTRKPVVANRL